MSESPGAAGPPDALPGQETAVASAPPAHAASIHAAQLSDVGSVRERNEDSCYVMVADAGGFLSVPPFGLFLVADGMGGHYGGDQASLVATRVVAREILAQVYEPLLAGEAAAADSAVQILHDAVLAAHAAVYDPDPLKNGGTTLTAALILGSQLHVAHVGDSRAYWLCDGKLLPITRDHSLVQRLVDNGQLTSAEAQDYQYRNVLLRALGQEDDLTVDTHNHALPSQGKLLLCSDGLCGMLSDEALQQLLNQSLPLQVLTRQLVDAALSAGSQDNVTAVVVDFTFHS